MYFKPENVAKRAEAIIGFWFDGTKKSVAFFNFLGHTCSTMTSAAIGSLQKKWFAGGLALDQEVRDLFLKDLEEVEAQPDAFFDSFSKDAKVLSSAPL